MTENASPDLSPRKKAKQARSQAKINLILDTTLTLLGQGDVHQISTNLIARQAGISVGTLYQFFPNKQAIYFALYENWLGQTLHALDQVFDRISDMGNTHNVKSHTHHLLQMLSNVHQINAKGHWHLRRAMATTSDLEKLDQNHQEHILKKIMILHQTLGIKLSADQARLLAYLQHQVSIACLNSLAQAQNEQQYQQLHAWCHQLLQFVFDPAFADLKPVETGLET